ncbi:hypothetical protein [Paraburkholderia caribensis]|uniref:hypothetical protein n=1 Tax=Paraburkholderia caribensis TaxID=75105 RepID=UPI001CB1E304|nr:hypothetical protein [Paraburkholderia caribensis]CAG9243296.1 hypothetical protein PCAR4_1330005 [Paraburkholderia caribensis]
MHLTEGNWEVDITTDFAIGLYFPRVRISEQLPYGSHVPIYDPGNLSPGGTAEQVHSFVREAIGRGLDLPELDAGKRTFARPNEVFVRLI